MFIVRKRNVESWKGMVDIMNHSIFILILGSIDLFHEMVYQKYP